MGAMNDRPPVDPQTPFTGKFRRLVDATVLKLQNTQEFQDALVNRKAVVPSPHNLSALVRRAGNFLKGQLDQLAKDDPDFLVPDSDQIEKASDSPRRRRSSRSR